MSEATIDSERLAARILRRVEELGTTVNEVEARHNALSRIRNILQGRSRHPRIDTVEKIAAMLETTSDYLLERTDDPSPGVRRTPTGEAARTRLPAIRASDADPGVPVRGVAVGAVLSRGFEGVTIGAEAVRFVPPPPAFRGVRAIYAVMVAGRSMIPEHKPLDLRFVHETLPYRPGDTVIVRTRAWDGGPEQSYIKHYLGPSRAGFERFEQLSPDARIDIPTKSIVHIHRVLTTAELFGA